MNEKKHVVITGADSGLGASLARKYNEMGHHVTLLGRTLKKLNAVASSFSNNNYSISTLNVANVDSVIEIFDAIHRDAGPIDILINNAGVGYFDATEQMRINHINQMIDINLKGTIFCTQQVIHEMRERDAGSIINIISTAGLEGKANESVYSASKFGVRGFTESIAKELEDTNIRVSGIYMGGMGTPFWEDTPEASRLDEMMDPDEVADIIIANTQERNKINVPKVVIKNH